jgi:hypothetical protein
MMSSRQVLVGSSCFQSFRQSGWFDTIPPPIRVSLSRLEKAAAVGDITRET